jgi:hypothetical protein
MSGVFPARSFFVIFSTLISFVPGVQTPPPQAPVQVPQGKTAASRITAATNVTLRALPSTNAAAVAQLPLGTELTDSGPADLDRTWVRVKLADGREGWLRSDLTKPIDHAWRWPTFDRIIEERLGRKGDGFAAQAELVAFIDRVVPEYSDAEGRARIDLARLRALQAALGSIPFRGDQREPYASWLGARKSTVTYDEPAGRWLVASATIWDLQSKHANTAAADELAWFAVTNGLPGECEGYLPCYLRWRNRLQGEYLRRQPNGRHVDEAIGLVKETADTLGASPKPNEAYEFDRARDCKDLAASVDALVGAIRATKSAGKDAAIASLTGLRKVCGG